MKLEHAQKLSGDFAREIKPFCAEIMVCGSTRRKRPEPKDIDIVIIPSNMFLLKPKLKQLGKVELDGNKLIRMKYRGEQIDLYFATPETYETLCLIRTGSALHNIKLCSLAKQKGWKLHASGMGLLDRNGRIVANTERGILEILLGIYVKPEERG